MATTTAPATETANATVTILAVSPKLLNAIKQLVSKDLAYQADRGKRLLTIEEMLREEKARGLSKKKLNLELLENGMDAPTASKLLSFVFTEHEEEIQKVNAHNAKQDGKRTGQTVSFDEKRKIAKGETTLEKLLIEKAAPKVSNSNAVNKGQGKVSAPSTAPAVNVEPPKYDRISGRAAIVRLLEKMEKDGLSPEEVAEVNAEALDIYMSNDELPEVAEAK